MSKQETFEQLCQEISAILGAAGVTPEDLLASLPEARKRVYIRRYGKIPAEGTKPRRPRKK